MPPVCVPCISKPRSVASPKPLVVHETTSRPGPTKLSKSASGNTAITVRCRTRLYCCKNLSVHYLNTQNGFLNQFRNLTCGMLISFISSVVSSQIGTCVHYLTSISKQNVKLLPCIYMILFCIDWCKEKHRNIPALLIYKLYKRFILLSVWLYPLVRLWIHQIPLE